MLDEKYIPHHLKLAVKAAALFPHARMAQTGEVAEVDLDADDEGAIVLLFPPEELDVRHRVVDWQGPHTPVMTTRRWKRVKYGGGDEAWLIALVFAAEEAWKARLNRCVHCGQYLAPERITRIGNHLCCHGCSEQHHGICH